MRCWPPWGPSQAHILSLVQLEHLEHLPHRPRRGSVVDGFTLGVGVGVCQALVLWCLRVPVGEIRGAWGYTGIVYIYISVSLKFVTINIPLF